VERELATERLGLLHAAQGVFYAGGPDDALRELLTHDVAWHIPGENPIAGTYVGIDAVIAYFTRRREIASLTFKMHAGEVLVGDGDHVAALTDGTAVLGGQERRWSTVGLYRFRGDRIAACWLLPMDAREFDLIWSAAGG
jgi:ketosteroid isomerase-like protein